MLEPAERLEAIKRHFGLSNVELGKVAGVSKQAVNNWFNLNAVPGRDAANKICRKLDISMKWLAEGSGKMLEQGSDDSDSVRSLIGKVAQLDEESAQAVIKYIDFIRRES